MAKKFIIHEKPGMFELEERKEKVFLFSDPSFDKVYSKAKELAGNEQIFGITHIGKKDARHPKFQGFKTPKVCAYAID